MISIIGAGPAGSYTAYLLAKAGKDVNVYEEHKEIGRPLHCTGVLPSTITKFLSMNNDFVLNTIDRIKIYSPDNNSVEIELKKENYVVDREKFDNYLAEKAIDLGVKYFLGWKFKDFKNNHIIFDNGVIRTDTLIGADGPTSVVAHKTNLYYDRKFAVGMQTTVDMYNEEDLIKNFVGKGYFGWVVPENSKRARVGVVADEHCKEYFNSFLKKLNIHSTTNLVSGLIPVYNPNVRISRNNVYLVGDAAMQVKATTYGGIVHGFFGAQQLLNAILHKQDYGKLCQKKFGRDLKSALLIRNKLDRMSDEDYNYLVKLVKQPRIKNILSKYERDYAFKIVLNMLIKEPRFLKFLFI